MDKQKPRQIHFVVRTHHARLLNRGYRTTFLTLTALLHRHKAGHVNLRIGNIQNGTLQLFESCSHLHACTTMLWTVSGIIVRLATLWLNRNLKLTDKMQFQMHKPFWGSKIFDAKQRQMILYHNSAKHVTIRCLDNVQNGNFVMKLTTFLEF